MSTQPFRLLNENEKSCILKAAGKGRIKDHMVLWSEELQVSYEYMQGGFCICILVFDDRANADKKLIWRGASRRSYKDQRNPIRGETLAFSRAILFSRPVELS